MKKILIFISLLLTYVSQGQISDAKITDTIALWIVPNLTKSITAAQMNAILDHLNNSKINKDSIVAVRTNAAKDTLFIKYKTTLDTIVLLHELDNLSDVTLTTPDASDMLILDDETMKWVNRPLIQVYDSMQHEAATAPTPYATWKRDATNEQLEVANETDKIKELMTKERSWDGGLVTFSFDDGYKTDYSIMLPLFKANNIVASSNIVTSWVGNPAAMTWAEIDSLHQNGWEICSHSATHQAMDTLTTAELITELLGSKDTIEAHGIPVKNMAYPFGIYNDLVKEYTRKYYRSARGTGGTYNPDYLNFSPLNQYALTTYTLDLPSDTTVVKLYIDSCYTYNKWLILYIHQTNSADSVAIARMIDYIQAKSMRIVTMDHGLDLVGNAIDVDGGFNINDNNMTFNGVIWRNQYPFLSTPQNGTATGRNLFIGYQGGNLTLSPAGGAASLASGNTGMGYQSSYALTTGYGNSSFGSLSLKVNTTGFYNSSFGTETFLKNTTGKYGTAIGALALNNAVSADYNTAVGYGAGKNTLGAQNTFVGAISGTGSGTTSGTYNASCGYGALEDYSTGSYLSAFGTQSLANNTTGNYNAAVGYGAGYTNTTGSSNVYFGYHAGFLGNGSNNISLGYRAGRNETGSYKFYVAMDSTSWANGMASGSKLLLYGDMSNAAKSNHFLNIFAKVSIGAAKDPNEMLSVTGNASITGYLKSGTGSIADNDSTPSVASYNTFIYAGSANAVSIDALDDHVVGCYYTIIGNSNTYTITVIDGTPAGGDSFNLAGGNWVGGSQDVLLLYCIAADAFIEVSRSDN